MPKSQKSPPADVNRSTLRLAVSAPLRGLAYIALFPFIGLAVCAIIVCKRLALAVARSLPFSAKATKPRTIRGGPDRY